MKRKQPWRPGPLVAVIVTAILAILFAWYVRPAQASPDAAFLATDASVKVSQASWGILFEPRGQVSGVGLVFYPGAKVPPEAYAYLANAAARAGHVAAIVRFPLNFAVFSPSKANVVLDALPAVKTWVVGGHSLGGAMASAFVAGNPGPVAGLLLLAAYPGGGTDLSAATLPVLSLSASNDGLATPAKIQAARRLLPLATRYVEISGGNHAQFGQYGLQQGDGTATLDGAVQRKAVIEESLGLLASVAAGARK